RLALAPRPGPERGQQGDVLELRRARQLRLLTRLVLGLLFLLVLVLGRRQTRDRHGGHRQRRKHDPNPSVQHATLSPASVVRGWGLERTSRLSRANAECSREGDRLKSLEFNRPDASSSSGP